MEKTKTRKTYTAEFKRQAVERALENNDVMQTARDLGVDHTSIRKWIKDVQQNADQAFPGSGNPRNNEIKAIKREISKLREENEILKKAAGIFALRSRKDTSL
ncbi:transposase [Cyclonatronum proteinivorum]|uniref:Transposase n=1 Tax=Cyclonatronum proteinivorum TaxID=1457365 RepID=A0A345UPA3_9BACT|nr:transposase [Cyclonatronum proteinivorum]AXJ02305.1 transposase [Cyclonatronum proteinivorum]